MRSNAGVIVVAFIAVGTGFTQPSAAKQPAFEVVTIKPSPVVGHVGPAIYPGGRIKIGHATLRSLIYYALNVETFQIAGGPGWIYSDMYDVEARPPADSPAAIQGASSGDDLTTEQREMLLALLADRFQLRFHRETRDLPIYLLERTGKELKMSEAADKSYSPWVGNDNNGGMMTGTGMAGVDISMPVLAERLIFYLGRRVEDKTGLSGSYDFKYHYATAESHPDIVSSILTSLHAIGLKVEASRGPVEMVTIDSAGRPSAN
jgi:uncharacterized protein (TIGR03435 family)